MLKGINGLPTIIFFVSFSCLLLELDNYIRSSRCALRVELLELVHVVAFACGVRCCLTCLMLCICSIVHVHAYLVCDACMEYNTWISQGRTKVVVFVTSFILLFPSSNKSLNLITTSVLLSLLSSSSNYCCFNHFFLFSSSKSSSLTTTLVLSLLSSNSSSNCCCFSHFLSSIWTWVRATLILLSFSSPLFSSTYYYPGLSLLSSLWVVDALVLLSLLSSPQVVVLVLPSFPIFELKLLPP